jgi:hypothetical protein
MTKTVKLSWKEVLKRFTKYNSLGEGMGTGGGDISSIQNTFNNFFLEREKEG